MEDFLHLEIEVNIISTSTYKQDMSFTWWRKCSCDESLFKYLTKYLKYSYTRRLYLNSINKGYQKKKLKAKYKKNKKIDRKLNF